MKTIFCLAFLGVIWSLDFGLDNCIDLGYDRYECTGSNDGDYSLTKALFSAQILTVNGDITSLNVKAADRMNRIIFKDVIVGCSSIQSSTEVKIEVGGVLYTCQVNKLKTNYNSYIVSLTLLQSC